MFTGRSSSSSSKAYASSTSVISILYCALLIILDIDHVTSMSLDKLVLGRNEIGQNDQAAPIAFNSLVPEAVMPENENTDMYTLLPMENKGIDRNTIEEADMEAAQNEGDMLMMETNESPAMSVMVPQSQAAEVDEESQNLPAESEIMEEKFEEQKQEQEQEQEQGQEQEQEQEQEHEENQYKYNSTTPTRTPIILADMFSTLEEEQNHSLLKISNNQEGHKIETQGNNLKATPEKFEYQEQLGDEIVENMGQPVLQHVEPAGEGETTKPVVDVIADALKDIVDSVKDEKEDTPTFIPSQVNAEKQLYSENEKPIEKENEAVLMDNVETEGDNFMDTVMDGVFFDTIVDAVQDVVEDQAETKRFTETATEVESGIQDTFADEAHKEEGGNVEEGEDKESYNTETNTLALEDMLHQQEEEQTEVKYLNETPEKYEFHEELENAIKESVAEQTAEEEVEPASEVITESPMLQVVESENIEAKPEEAVSMTINEDFQKEAEASDEKTELPQIKVTEEENLSDESEITNEKIKETERTEQNQEYIKNDPIDELEEEEKVKELKDVEMFKEENEEEQVDKDHMKEAVQNISEHILNEEENVEKQALNEEKKMEEVIMNQQMHKLEDPIETAEQQEEKVEENHQLDEKEEIVQEQQQMMINQPYLEELHDQVMINGEKEEETSFGDMKEETAAYSENPESTQDKNKLIPATVEESALIRDEDEALAEKKPELEIPKESYDTESENMQNIEEKPLEIQLDAVENQKPEDQSIEMKDEVQVPTEISVTAEQVIKEDVKEFESQPEAGKDTLVTLLHGDDSQIDADKAVQQPLEVSQETGANSMLTKFVHVPQQQQQQLQLEQEVKPIQDNVEMLTKLESAAVKPEIEMQMQQKQPQPLTQQQNEEKQQQKPTQQQQQQQPHVTIESDDTFKPLKVMDSVLNYVNASFINRLSNSNNNNKIKNNNMVNSQPSFMNEFSSKLRRYEGAQVWRIVVQNDRDKKLADELLTKYDGQLWKEVKAEVDYLLKPQVLVDAEKHIRRANLSRIVLIDNLQKVIEVENPTAEEISQFQNRKGHRLTWRAYHRLADIHGFFDYLAKTYPDICSVETIGYSLEKRPLKILKISNGNSGNPGIWIDGGMHAREWISPAAVTFVTNEIVEGWDDLPAYMKNVNWYIHAVANPDGYEYTHTTDRLWRKNMRSHGRQCPGVDLNRNFGYKWGGRGTSANPCSQTYRGSKAFSEPETFYISKFISNFPRETFQAYLSFHSYGQYILYPWGYDYQLSADRDDLDRVGRQAGTIITKNSGVKYTVGPSATTLYPAAGGSDDWAKGIAGIKYSYTIEMGDTGRYGFVLPASQIENNGKDALTFVETVARAVMHQDMLSRKRSF